MCFESHLPMVFRNNLYVVVPFSNIVLQEEDFVPKTFNGFLDTGQWCGLFFHKFVDQSIILYNMECPVLL